MSDRTDNETQTNPPTRATSTGHPAQNEIHDAIVQTDQRLTYLLKSAANRVKKWDSDSKNCDPMPSIKKTFADAGVQTYIEVQSVGIQVDPIELKEFYGGSKQKSITPFNFEDASDFSDADISTVHAYSTIINRHKSSAKR